ncbi:MAG: tryptophan synthase subunit alpha [Candidatus Aminicenantales bacterium]
MANPIDAALAQKKKLKLMTHVLAGYPDLQTSEQLIVAMAESGADMIEIQIPFSDPLADGPTIMAANAAALKSGMTPRRCLDMVRELKKAVPVPLLIMTYANIVCTMGMEKFISESAECGVSGLILPDLPFDERNCDYYTLVKKYSLYGILVLSAGMATQRLKRLLKMAEGFVYITLRVGTTGAVKTIASEGLDFLESVKKYTSLPRAAGFGISAAEHIGQLKGRVEIAVIGSHLINLLNSGGLKSVKEFIEECHTLL